MNVITESPLEKFMIRAVLITSVTLFLMLSFNSQAHAVNSHNKF